MCTPGLVNPGWLVLLRVPGAQAGKGTVEPGEPPRIGARFQPKPEPDEATPGVKAAPEPREPGTARPPQPNTARRPRPAGALEARETSFCAPRAGTADVSDGFVHTPKIAKQIYAETRAEKARKT